MSGCGCPSASVAEDTRFKIVVGGISELMTPPENSKRILTLESRDQEVRAKYGKGWKRTKG